MSLSIGDVARRAQVSVDTVRYYEHEGLLPRASRDAAGRRVYDESILDAFTLINALRGAGFGVAEVRAITSLKDEPDVAERLRGILGNCHQLDRALAERSRQLAAAKKLVRAMRREAEEHLDRRRAQSAAGSTEGMCADR